MHTDSAITFRIESAIIGAEPVMANCWVGKPARFELEHERSF